MRKLVILQGFLRGFWVRGETTSVWLQTHRWLIPPARDIQGDNLGSDRTVQILSWIGCCPPLYHLTSQLPTKIPSSSWGNWLAFWCLPFWGRWQVRSDSGLLPRLVSCLSQVSCVCRVNCYQTYKSHWGLDDALLILPVCLQTGLQFNCHRIAGLVSTTWPNRTLRKLAERLKFDLPLW